MTTQVALLRPRSNGEDRELELTPEQRELRRVLADLERRMGRLEAKVEVLETRHADEEERGKDDA